MENARQLRIVFMGTPEFAVPSLRALVAGGYHVVAVVTTPDKPAGRGQKLHESDVKVAARELGLPVLQPVKLRDPEFVEALRALQPDLGIVIAFRMLPEIIWAMPRLGTFNLHASLLPQYRGAAPINWAIINGETETGVTTFLLNHEIDKGAILDQVRVPIGPEDTVGTMYERLMNIGTSLVTQTVDRIAAGDITPVEQQSVDERTLRPAPKIFKEDCRIDWTQPGKRIVDFIRGLSPYPAAWTEMYREGNAAPSTVKIFSATFEQAQHDEPCANCNLRVRNALRCMTCCWGGATSTSAASTDRRGRQCRASDRCYHKILVRKTGIFSRSAIAAAADTGAHGRNFSLRPGCTAGQSGGRPAPGKQKRSHKEPQPPVFFVSCREKPPFKPLIP